MLFPLKVRPLFRHYQQLKGGSVVMGPHAEGSIERWALKRQAALIMRVFKGEASVAEVARLHVLRVADVESWQE